MHLDHNEVLTSIDDPAFNTKEKLVRGLQGGLNRKTYVQNRYNQDISFGGT